MYIKCNTVVDIYFLKCPKVHIFTHFFLEKKYKMKTKIHWPLLEMNIYFCNISR